MQEIFLGRQPILDRNQYPVAHELLFRSGHTAHAGVIDGVSASASVIVNTYAELGIQNVLGKQRGFINVNAELLMSDLIHLLPKSQVVLELLETVEITDEIVRRCGELRSMGYQLALDDVVAIDDRTRLLLPLMNVAKVDLLRLETDALPHLIDSLKSWPLLLLAEKVESAEQARHCMALGFDMFQGYHFARPQIIAGKRADPSQMGLLRLLELVMSDADTADIEQEFKRHPSLVYGLMRMANSVACGLTHKISTLRQGIIVLGRKQLQRWMQLLLYTVGNSDSQAMNALMQLAATRGKLMELIATVERPGDKQYQESAFMTGILSLLDALLGMPLPEIISQLNLTDEIKVALLFRKGNLGNLLMLLEKKERNDIETVSVMLTELGFMGMGELVIAELEALRWTNGLDEVSR